MKRARVESALRWVRRLSVSACFGLTVVGAVGPASAQATGAVNLAMIGEPQTLDPMASTADLVGTIMQHVYEPLYTFDGQWNIAPMLAEGMPKYSSDGKTVTIELRKGVKFHNGRDMNAEDVVASLKRWMEMAPRGKAVAAEIRSVEAKGEHTVVLTQRGAYAPLLAQLALPSGFAAIMPKETIANPLTQYIGTGPYQFKERRPDQFVLLTRFDGYSARSEPASGYAGRRQALIQELRFIPVPNANTRVEGALSGQYHFADLLPVESYARITNRPGVDPVITAPFGFPYVVLNTVQGPLANKQVRQAIQAALNMNDIMAAGFGDPKFFAVEGNHYPKGSPFFSEARVSEYNQGNAIKARELAKGAYKGEPIRYLTSKQFEFHYRMAVVMADQLKAAGFNVDLQVVDWATLIQRRGDHALWEIFLTHSPFLPEPMLTPPQLGEGAPGGWKSQLKELAILQFTQQQDPARRGALWGNIQSAVYEEVPYIKLGNFNSLTAKSTRLADYNPLPWPYFWNARLSR